MPRDLTPDDLMPEYATPTFRLTPHMLEVVNEYGADFLGVEAYLDHRETTLTEFARKKGIALDVPWPTGLATATGSPDGMQPEITLALRLIPALAILPRCHTLEIGIKLEANPFDPTEWGEEPDGAEAARYMHMHLYGEPMGMPNGFGDDIHDDAVTELHLLAHRIICTCVSCGHRPAMIGVATEVIAAQLRGPQGARPPDSQGATRIEKSTTSAKGDTSKRSAPKGNPALSAPSGQMPPVGNPVVTAPKAANPDSAPDLSGIEGKVTKVCSILNPDCEACQ